MKFCSFEFHWIILNLNSKNSCLTHEEELKRKNNQITISINLKYKSTLLRSNVIELKASIVPSQCILSSLNMACVYIYIATLYRCLNFIFFFSFFHFGTGCDVQLIEWVMSKIALCTAVNTEQIEKFKLRCVHTRHQAILMLCLRRIRLENIFYVNSYSLHCYPHEY